ncbi:uncharacterized protein LOC123269717 [Cotesia glomerata]|uniref:uncharacterized protein LOC123269717 n=1 Tax=Cotesia glomerata TaxID=32391 RepID=UPI001D01ED61|nr:uncharacterized protein LOC123269717 [Cotesia glomerata]
MPGMKDFVSIRNDDGNQVPVQKRLVLSNLKELYQCFREINAAEKIRFSRFASLRPKHCVLAGASGTHTICVCTIHQNVKLMMLGANIHSLTRNTDISITHYSDCLSLIVYCNNHDAVAVHVFIKLITDYVKSLPERCNKIYYFSDGAPQQFKNFKNFVNLYYHEEDFDIPAEWHFFATAHGKGPCDGIGGTIKRYAARASLQLAVDKQITMPEELFEWTSDPDNLPNIITKFSPEEDYKTAVNDLNERFLKIKPITGTQQLHCIIPDKNGCLYIKNFSNSNEHKICKIFKRQRRN